MLKFIIKIKEHILYLWTKAKSILGTGGSEDLLRGLECFSNTSGCLTRKPNMEATTAINGSIKLNQNWPRKTQLSHSLTCSTETKLSQRVMPSKSTSSTNQARSSSWAVMQMSKWVLQPSWVSSEIFILNTSILSTEDMEIRPSNKQKLNLSNKLKHS